jgi:hypothetical protein
MAASADIAGGSSASGRFWPPSVGRENHDRAERRSDRCGGRLARVERDLDSCGWGSLGRLLEPQTRQSFVALFDEDRRFRSRIDMERYGF